MATQVTDHGHDGVDGFCDDFEKGHVRVLVVVVVVSSLLGGRWCDGGFHDSMCSCVVRRYGAGLSPKVLVRHTVTVDLTLDADLQVWVAIDACSNVCIALWWAKVASLNHARSRRSALYINHGNHVMALLQHGSLTARREFADW